MPPPNIDPVLFGQLLESVKNLVDKVEGLEASVQTLTTQVDTLNNLKNTGRGILLGALISGGGLGAIVSQWMEHFK